MFPRFACYCLGLAALFSSCHSKGPPAAESIRIPLLADAPAMEWPAKALQIEVLNPRPGSQVSNASRLAVAWSEQGLKLWMDVDDSTPFEAAETSNLWMADSIELFVASPAGSKQFIQMLGSPGRVADFRQPRWKYIDRQVPKPVLQDPEMKIQAQAGGYRLYVLFPWSNLARPPKEGDKIGVQLFINNASSGAAKTRMTWAPSEDGTNPETYATLQLGREAGAAQKTVAWIGVEKLNELVVQCTTTAEQAGQGFQVRTEPAGTWTTLGRMGKPEGGRSRGSFVLDPSFKALAGQKLETQIDGHAVATIEIPDLKALRTKALHAAVVISKPSVFGEKSFPPIEFLSKDLAEAAFGTCTMKIRWFNAAGEEVTEAATPGRYGALVNIQTEDGLNDQRRITLYRTAQPFSTRVDRYESQLKFPPAFGLSAETAQSEKEAANEFMNYRLHSLARQDEGWAVLLAGLQDLNDHPVQLHGLDVWAINQDWWDTLEKKLGTAKPYEYLVYLPKGYEADPSKSWPLVLFLHGSGERGSDLNKVKKNGLTKLLEEGKDYPFITIAPQCPDDVWWSAVRLDDLVNLVAAKYRVDTKRLYVTGLSLGGYGAWNLAGHYPEKYAAAVPVCGGALADLGPKLKNMPVWAFHGADDVTVPTRASRIIVDAIFKAGGKPKLTIYPGVAHNSWVQAYDEPGLYTWLLEQKKP